MLKTNVKKSMICIASALVISGLGVNVAYAEENEFQAEITVEVSENTTTEEETVNEVVSADDGNGKSESIDIIEINPEIIVDEKTGEDASVEVESASEDVSTEAARYVYVYSKTVELSAVSSNLMECKVSILCNPVITKMIGAVILYDETAGSEKASWSINTASNSYSLDEYIRPTSGHTYSLKLYAELYTSSSSKKVESIDGISTGNF